MGDTSATESLETTKQPKVWERHMKFISLLTSSEDTFQVKERFKEQDK